MSIRLPLCGKTAEKPCETIQNRRIMVSKYTGAQAPSGDTMTRDLQEIKEGLAQIRAALNLLEKFVAEYEARTVNILPCEDVKFYAATDDEVIEGSGIGETVSL